MQIGWWVALHPWQQLLQKRLGKTRPGRRRKALRLPSPSRWPRPGPWREHHASTCTRHAQPPFLHKSPEMELRLLLVPFPRRLIINQDRSFWAADTVNSGLGAQFATRVHFGHPTPGACARSTQTSTPARPLAGGDAGIFTRSVSGPPPTGLLCSRGWRGAAAPSLLCPALPGPARPGPGALPPPGYQARGGAGPARPAPAVEGARRVLLAVIPARAFYLGAAGEAGGGDTGGGP